MRVTCLFSIAAIVCCSALLPARVLADEPRSTEEWLDAFSQAWDETQWEKSYRTAPNGFMRPLGQRGWKVRMQALQGVVQQGEKAIPALLVALNDKDTPRRIFAAQALGYLAPHVTTDPLLVAAKNDPDPAVRIYAVDALGMKGGSAVDFAALEDSEQSRDVLKHIGYARERNGQPVDPAIIKQLVEWDPSTMDSAVVGKAAPDLALKTPTGETIRLSDYRGKQAVVLVFIYGDT